jgi:hypothetical protein
MARDFRNQLPCRAIVVPTSLELSSAFIVARSSLLSRDRTSRDPHGARFSVNPGASFLGVRSSLLSRAHRRSRYPHGARLLFPRSAFARPSQAADQHSTYTNHASCTTYRLKSRSSTDGGLYEAKRYDLFSSSNKRSSREKKNPISLTFFYVGLHVTHGT